MPRLNAILVVSRKTELLKTAATWITRLDNSDAASTGVKVYRMRYGDARQVAALLNDIFLGNSSAPLDLPTNQLIPGGGAVVHDARDARADHLQVADGAGDERRLLSAGDRQDDAIHLRRNDRRGDAGEDRIAVNQDDVEAAAHRVEQATQRRGLEAKRHTALGDTERVSTEASGQPVVKGYEKSGGQDDRRGSGRTTAAR